jgi:hypothetical protein
VSKETRVCACMCAHTRPHGCSVRIDLSTPTLTLTLPTLSTTQTAATAAAFRLPPHAYTPTMPGLEWLQNLQPVAAGADVNGDAGTLCGCRGCLVGVLSRVKASSRQLITKG